MSGTQHVASSEGRHRVAYEMALNMWLNSKPESPNLDTSKEFLDLVAKCTYALAHHNS